MALGYAVALRNTRLDAITTRAGTSAKLRIFKGTRPATGGSETDLLVQCICNASAFAAGASGGQLTANAIADGTAGDSGTASWWRLQSSADVHVMDGDVGGPSSGADMELSSTSIVSGGTVSITSFVITAGNP
jgi:hypothetical protein